MGTRKIIRSVFLGVIATICAIIFAGLVYLFVLGTLSETGVVPSTEIQSGSELTERQMSQLLAEGIILEGEVIKFFYSEGIYSVLEGGNILTENEVISYLKNADGALEIYSIPIKDIKTIEVLEEGSFFSDSIYKISGQDPENWVEVWLSVENDGHLKFINALEAQLVKEPSQ